MGGWVLNYTVVRFGEDLAFSIASAVCQHFSYRDLSYQNGLMLGGLLLASVRPSLTNPYFYTILIF